MLQTVVRSLRGANKLGERAIFDYVATVGPWPSEVTFRAPHHLMLDFDDVETEYETSQLTGSPYRGPSRAEVEAIIDFARSIPEDTPVLVHCHAGISRSTATALVMNIARGATLAEAWEVLVRHHYDPRVIWPNRLILRHAEAILDRPGLIEAVERLERLEGAGALGAQGWVAVD